MAYSPSSPGYSYRRTRSFTQSYNYKPEVEASTVVPSTTQKQSNIPDFEVQTLPHPVPKPNSPHNWTRKSPPKQEQEPPKVNVVEATTPPAQLPFVPSAPNLHSEQPGIGVQDAPEPRSRPRTRATNQSTQNAFFLPASTVPSNPFKFQSSIAPVDLICCGSRAAPLTGPPTDPQNYVFSVAHLTI